MNQPEFLRIQLPIAVPPVELAAAFMEDIGHAIS
jgi:hypothetical protein